MKNRIVSIILILFLIFAGLGAPAAAADKKGENWQDESIYYIMVDRFNNGDTANDFTMDSKNPLAYHGGDFKGVSLQLDYIKDMGFTTIALSPIFENQENGYHGYWINDFYKTEEHFGTQKEFKSLVKEAHKRNLKVMVELPATAVGTNHPWVNEADKQAWFGVADTTANGLKKLNLEHNQVQEYIIEVAQWWLTETGIDGYMLNEVQNMPSKFLNDFSKEIKLSHPNAFLLANGANSNKPEMDGFFDYQGNQVLRKGFAKPDSSLEEIVPIIEKNQQLIESEQVVGNFLDNLQMNRYTHDAVVNNLHPGSRWKLALTYLYTVPGVPIVYYGSEIALEGNENDHKQMDFRTDQELVEYITTIGELRNQIPALTKGTFEPLYAEGGMIVYKREFEGETVIIAINNTSKTQSVEIDADKIAKDMELRGLIMDDQSKEKDGKYKLIVDRDEAEIYMVTEKSGLNIPYIVVMGIVYLLFTLFIILLLKRRKRKATE
ncbi:alpha-amylase family glycosyl hydrolase [Bacillus marasmi]|uniref:alpha-amylase family glycosyl hydrolase n=1 Tax=Bacillus marasmi TaxID=1926279 RepID=UPI0011CAF8D8|nr:alpha-amylase family glycosyl hydrolase [Bacillus marasmi]